MAFKPLQNLSNRHDKAIELLVYSDKTKQEIADEIGINVGTLWWWEHDPLFLEREEKVLKQKYKNLARDAQAMIYKIAMESESDSVRLNACKDILDRAGYKAVEETKISTDDSISINIGYDKE